MFFLSEDSGCAVLNPSKFLSIMKQEKAFSLLMVRFITGQSQPHDCGVSGLTFDSGIKSKPVLCFYPTALKGCRGIVFTHGVQMGVWAVSQAGGQREKVCQGCISETVGCRKFIFGRDIGLGV